MHRTLVKYVSHNVFEYTADCPDCESPIEAHNRLYVKHSNEAFAHNLATKRQRPEKLQTGS